MSWPIEFVTQHYLILAYSLVGLLLAMGIGVCLWGRFRAIAAHLRRSERRFDLLAEASEIGIFTCDDAFDYVNPAMSTITGYSEGDLYQMPVADLFGFDPGRELAGQAGGGPLHRETYVTGRNGAPRWLYVSLGMMEARPASLYLGTVFDITERKQMEEELRYLAFNDPLTDLPNRKFLMNRLEALFRDARLLAGKPGRTAPTSFALMFVDVNRFKSINDNFGLTRGDQLLKVIARRIKAALPRAVLVARVGGDEFALLFEDKVDAALLEDEAQRLQQAFAQVFHLGEQEFFLSLSIGVALYDPRYRDGEQIYRDATIAKDLAKRAGPGRSCVFDEQMHAAEQKRLQLEQDLRHALRFEHFELFYQPIVTLPDGEFRGFEALIRWRREDGTLVSPGEFIPLAEETGLINPLGDWVLQQACRQIGRWNSERVGSRSFYVSVNLSSVQFFQSGLIETVRQALALHGVRPGQLKLELTESILADDNPQVIDRMQHLMHMGCSIMVDDFGTGYSSLSYLQRFPLNVLKIDQSFVARMDEETGLHLVRAIISMAHALELGVIAEGIETPEVAQQLSELGCELGQGYHFARPMPASAATDYVSRRTARSQSSLF